MHSELRDGPVWLLIMVLAVCNFPRAEAQAASTNTTSGATGFDLSPEMERLNKSKWFKSTLDQFDRVIFNHLEGNVIPEETVEPVFTLGAMRRQKEFEPPQYWITLWAYSTHVADTAMFTTNQQLQLMIDGVRVTLADDLHPPSMKLPEDSSRLITEMKLFRCDPELIRRIGTGKRVQMRIETDRKYDRWFSPVNIARFKVFTASFIDVGTNQPQPQRRNDPSRLKAVEKAVDQSAVLLRGEIIQQIDEGFIVHSRPGDSTSRRDSTFDGLCLVEPSPRTIDWKPGSAAFITGFPVGEITVTPREGGFKIMRRFTVERTNAIHRLLAP